MRNPAFLYTNSPLRHPKIGRELGMADGDERADAQRQLPVRRARLTAADACFGRELREKQRRMAATPDPPHAAAGARAREEPLPRPALPVGLAVLAAAPGGERVRATVVAATARRDYVMIEHSRKRVSTCDAAVALADIHAASQLVAAFEHASKLTTQAVPAVGRNQAHVRRLLSAQEKAAPAASWKEVHVSQLMPIASDVPVVKYKLKQHVRHTQWLALLPLPCSPFSP